MECFSFADLFLVLKETIHDSLLIFPDLILGTWSESGVMGETVDSHYNEVLLLCCDYTVSSTLDVSVVLLLHSVQNSSLHKWWPHWPMGNVYFLLNTGCIIQKLQSIKSGENNHFSRLVVCDGQRVSIVNKWKINNTD